MRKAHSKTLMTGNYHVKDEKELNSETLQEYQNCTAKKTLTATYTVSDA